MALVPQMSRREKDIQPHQPQQSVMQYREEELRQELSCQREASAHLRELGTQNDQIEHRFSSTCLIQGGKKILKSNNFSSIYLMYNRTMNISIKG